MDRTIQLTQNTEIHTKNGWKKLDDVSYGEYVYSLNNKTMKGEYAKVREITSKNYVGEVLELNSTRINMEVPENSEILVNSRKNNNKSETKPYYEEFRDIYEYVTRGNSLRIHSSCKLKTIKNKPKLDPLWRLIGFYIGDGYTYKNKKGKITKIFITVTKVRKVEYIINLCRELGVNERPKIRNKYVTFEFTDSRVLDIINYGKIDGYDNKRLPFKYKGFDRESIFDGLINSDGHLKKKCKYYFSSNYELISDVEHLGIELGYTTRIDTRIIEFKGKELIKHTLTLTPLNTKYIDKNNIELKEYSGLVYEMTISKDNGILIRQEGTTAFI